MKIKIKDFKGILTNNDENDNNLEFCTESENFLHRKGFLEIDPRLLVEQTNASGELPIPTAVASGYDWAWETGIYTTLTSDILSTRDVPTPESHDILLLICKVLDSGTYHRLIFFKDFSDLGTGWYELSKHGNIGKENGYPIIDIENHDMNNNFTNSAMSTTIDGTTHFQVEDGRLKIYMPHDSFWFGKIDRKLHFTDNAQRWPVTIDGVVTYPHVDYEQDFWYLDRLTENWKHDNQRIRMWDQDNLTQIPYFDPLFYGPGKLTCAKGTPADELTRRTGIMYKLFVEEDATHVVGGRDITISDPHDNKVRKETEWSNFRCTRHTVNSPDGLPVVNPFGTFAESNVFAFWMEGHSPWYLGGHDGGGSEDDWTFDEVDKADVWVTFLPYGNQTFRLRSGESDHESLSSYRAWGADEVNGKAHIINVNTAHEVPEDCWSVSLEDIESNEWEYGGDLEAGDIGWTEVEDKFDIIVTAVLDDREEFAIGAHSWVVNPDTKYVLTISDIVLPYDINKRITRVKFYHRLKGGTDYEMVKDMDLLAKESTIEQFDISTEVYNGFFIATQTGYAWDYEERPADYKLINGWKDFVTESGISIGVSSRDSVAIYHSTYGGGNLMPDLVYDDNRLPVTGVSQLTAVANADGRLMAFTPHTAYVIEASEIAGVIAFRFNDTIEVGVKNKNDIANLQGGVLVHTRHGIYITNGFETKSISEGIDDKIRDNYATGRVYYNRYKHEVYYKPTIAEDLYRFRMVDAVWEHINKTVTPGEQQEEIGEVED